MKIKGTVRTLIILAILSSNVGCDQVSKHFVRQNIYYNEQVSLLNDYLTLTKVENTGAFLSIGYSLPRPLRILFLTVFPIIVLALAFIYLITTKDLSNLAIAGICFVIGGGIGNIYDRLRYGSVTDFLHIDVGIFQTGIFNLADVSIMMGIFVILFDLYHTGQKWKC